MGKGKAKKAKAATSEAVNSPSPPLCTCGHSHEPLRAADGHNVDGWTEEDIRIYNELLNERAKLEKEKNELEQKSARHQAERALLNEDAAAFDNLFKVQLSGEYKFTGSSPCCLDFSNDPSTARNGCHHEVCSRAKTHGVSWMEMDTVKYYQARITSERSQRMKNALRKQRDVELERVKKDDDEELAMRTRRSAMLDKSNSKHDDATTAVAKNSKPAPPSLLDALGGNSALLDPKDSAILDAARENELVVKRIRARLDKIRHDVHAGRVTAFDARLKLDQANREMAEAERKNNNFKEMIFTPGAGQGSSNAATAGLSQALSKSLSTSSKDAFSQALSVMKGFFSASDPRDVQAAITDLRSVFEINGPMPSMLQKSFQALEDMLAKPNAKGFAVDLTSSDGTTKTCHNVIEVLLTLRNSADAATLDATAKELKLDKATLEANKASILIEDAAFDKMLDTFTEKEECEPRQIYEAIRAIKDEAVKQSFVPPLSDIVLEDRMTGLLFHQAGLRLIFESVDGTDERKLQAMMTSIVIAYSDKDPEKYLPSLDRLARYFKEHHLSHREHHDPVLKIEGVLEHVRLNMRKFVDNARKKLSASPQASAPKTGPTAASGSLTPNPLQIGKQQDLSNLGIPTSQDIAKLMATLGLSGNTSAGNMPLRNMVNAFRQQLQRDVTAGDLTDLLTRDNHGVSASEKVRLQRDVEKLFASSTGFEDPGLLVRLQEQILAFADSTASIAEHAARSRKSTKAKDTGKTSKFQEELSPSPTPTIPMDGKPSPPPYMANEGRARSAVKVKHVPVSTPQISGARGSPSTAGSSSSPRAGLSEREAVIKRQLQAMHANMQKLATPTASSFSSSPSSSSSSTTSTSASAFKTAGALGTGVLGLRDPFQGITLKLLEQFEGHLAIARSFADVNGWRGLEEWMDREFR